MGKNKQNNPDKVSFVKMFGWQMRPISLGAMTIIFGYLQLFCTDVLEMSAVLVGTILMVSKIFDGITDLIAGWLIDNTKTRWGKGRPYEFSIIGVWACTYALFATSVEWSLTVKCIWIFIMYTLVWSIFSTLLNAAETPYMIRAFGSKIAITKVASYGGIIVTVGCMAVSVSFPMLVAAMATSSAGWRKLILMFAVPLTLLGILRFLLVKENYEVKKEEWDKVKIREILSVLKSNKYIWLLGIASLVPQMIVGMAAGTYYFSSVIGDISKYSVIQMVSMISLIFLVALPPLMKKFSAMQIVGIGGVIGLVGYVILFFAGTNMTMLSVGFMLAGIAALPTSYMRTVVVMQIADYNESKSAPRMEGTIASAVNFLCKIGQAVGVFLLGAMLSVGGYDGKLAVQPEQAQMMIRLSFSLVPAICMLAIIFSAKAFSPLDKWHKDREAS